MIDLCRKRILVTGGTGFFGSYIYNAFKVRGVDRVTSIGSTFVDLRNRKEVDRLLVRLRPEIVIHCAAHCGGIGLNKVKPAELFYDNIMMGVNLIDACYNHGVEKFVQLGTVCEYPKFTPTPFREDDLWNGYPEETNAPYGIAKKSLLVMGQAYRQQYGFNVIHLLPVNLYGPGDNFNLESSHVIPALIRKFDKAKVQMIPSVSVWGSGNVFREFLYVEDAAEAIVLATEKYDGADPVNIGTGNTISIECLSAMIAARVGYTGRIKYDATMPDGQPERCLDTKRALQAFGFKACTTLSAGLDKTIEWYVHHSQEAIL